MSFDCKVDSKRAFVWTSFNYIKGLKGLQSLQGLQGLKRLQKIDLYNSEIMSDIITRSTFKF